MRPLPMATVLLTLASPALAGRGEVGVSGVAAPELALLPLVASGLAVDEIGPLEASVRAAAEGHYGSRLLTQKLQAERLERGGAKGLRCDRSDPACSAQLGAVCGVARVLVASLAVAPGRSRLELRLVDVAEASQLAHAAGPVGDTPSAEELAALLRALDEPPAASTSLRVRGPAGSLLVVDGADRGALPQSAPLTDLSPGPHEVGLDGPSSFRRTVELRRGEPVVVEAPPPRASVERPPAPRPAPLAATTSSQPPAPAASLPRLPTMLAGGGAVAIGAVSLGVGLLPLFSANQSASRLAEREQRALQDPTVVQSEATQIRQDHDELVDARQSWESWGGLTAWVGGGLVATGLAVAGVGLALGTE